MEQSTRFCATLDFVILWFGIATGMPLKRAIVVRILDNYVLLAEGQQHLYGSARIGDPMWDILQQVPLCVAAFRILGIALTLVLAGIRPDKSGNTDSWTLKSAGSVENPSQKCFGHRRVWISCGCMTSNKTENKKTYLLKLNIYTEWVHFTMFDIIYR